MKSVKKKVNKGRYNFLIDESVYHEFSALCEELGFIRSKNLENYMKEFIKKNNKQLNNINQTFS